MDRPLLKDALGWGFLLWLIGYVLGIALFMLVPAGMIGWILTPVGTLITLWVLFRKVKAASMRRHVVIAFVWTAIAVVGDYLFIVKAFKPADGYYKPDVFLYYALTFLLPIAAGWRKSARKPQSEKPQA